MPGAKIIDKLNERVSAGQTFFSFEYFPPKTDEGVANLKERQMRMAALGPAFCDITWGAGGSTADVTLDVARSMQQEVRCWGGLAGTPLEEWGGEGGREEEGPRRAVACACSSVRRPAAAAACGERRWCTSPAPPSSTCTCVTFIGCCCCTRVQVGVETMMHLTCTNMPVDQLQEALAKVGAGHTCARSAFAAGCSQERRMPRPPP